MPRVLATWLLSLPRFGFPGRRLPRTHIAAAGRKPPIHVLILRHLHGHIWLHIYVRIFLLSYVASVLGFVRVHSAVPWSFLVYFRPRREPSPFVTPLALRPHILLHLQLLSSGRRSASGLPFPRPLALALSVLFTIALAFLPAAPGGPHHAPLPVPVGLSDPPRGQHPTRRLLNHALLSAVGHAGAVLPIRCLRPRLGAATGCPGLFTQPPPGLRSSAEPRLPPNLAAKGLANSARAPGRRRSRQRR